MAEFSKRLKDMLTEFMLCEISSRSLDGITYVMFLKEEKNKEIIQRYKEIKQEALNCGFGKDEVFRVYEISNGYIFDMDINTVKQITAEMIKSMYKGTSELESYKELRELPEIRRKKDILALGKYLKQEYEHGKRTLEVALFSRNSTNKIVINCKNKNGELLSIKYNAYAIRHWDIELVNEKILMPAGFRVSKIQPCEVLPSKTGVSFIFTLESMN